jgi:hypothetical protein
MQARMRLLEIKATTPDAALDAPCLSHAALTSFQTAYMRTSNFAVHPLDVQAFPARVARGAPAEAVAHGSCAAPLALRNERTATRGDGDRAAESPAARRVTLACSLSSSRGSRRGLAQMRALGSMAERQRLLEDPCPASPSHVVTAEVYVPRPPGTSDLSDTLSPRRPSACSLDEEVSSNGAHAPLRQGSPGFGRAAGLRAAGPAAPQGCGGGIADIFQSICGGLGVASEALPAPPPSRLPATPTRRRTLPPPAARD